MALFPDWMVCGFMPADRSNGGRDEKHSSESHTQTHRVTTLLNHRTDRDTFSHTHISHTPTHTWEKDKLLLQCVVLLISVTIGKQCLTNDYQAKTDQHKIMKMQLLCSIGLLMMMYTINVAVWMLFSWLIALNGCHVFSFSFFPSYVFSHFLVLLPPQVASAFIFTFVGVLAARLWFLTVCVWERGETVW